MTKKKEKIKTITAVQRRLGELYNYISSAHKEKGENPITSAEFDKILNHVFHETWLCVGYLAKIREQIRGLLGESE